MYRIEVTDLFCIHCNYNITEIIGQVGKRDNLGELLLFKGTYYPPLSIETPDWHALHDEIDGTGNGSWFVNILLPRTWMLQFVCHGTGDFKMSLRSAAQSTTPDIVTANARCNGRGTDYLFDKYGYGKTLRQVQITTGADNDWQAVLVSCTTGKPSCGITTATPTSMPQTE